jgi:hypothetical protein
MCSLCATVPISSIADKSAKADAPIHTATHSVVEEIPKENGPRILMLDSVTLPG